MIRIATVAVAAMLATMMSRVSAQGFPPDQAARRMTVADGFEVTLVAAEPLIRQPVAIDFDDRGRLWVVQYLQYPNPAGLKRIKVDRYSRTVYDKVPDPPPRGPRGADRITILEDTDGDGGADRARDFIDGLNLASAFALGHGGVFIVQAPYLLFYPDRNRDDVPDSDPEVLLTGFGMEDAHSVANSLTWGPDGWLYGCQGSTVTANIRGVQFQQGVWRYHPLTKEFELFCEGGGNSWGLDFDARGNLLYSTNFSPHRMLHGVQGGYYWKWFTKHGELHNPYAYGYIDHVPHDNFVGGHVTVGGMIYQSDALPAKYRGRFVAADLLGHAVYWNDLAPVGSSFRSIQGEPLLIANDTWFAPSDLTIGPDGAIYVADWSDQRTAHPDPDAEWDRSNGRIYRIAWKDAPKRELQDVSELPSAKLVELLANPNRWLVRRARRVLAERRDPAVHQMLRDRVQRNDANALEALWALYVTPGDTDVSAWLNHPNPDVRRWTIRFIGDADFCSDDVAARLVKLAKREADITVRSQLACTARRLPPDVGLAIIEQLVTHDEDLNDPHIPLLLWWAVEPHAIPHRQRVLELANAKSKLAHDALLTRLIRRYAAAGSDEALDACAQLLRASPDLLASFNTGWSEQTTALRSIPPSLTAVLNESWRDDTTDPVLILALVNLRHPPAVERARRLAEDDNAAVDVRLSVIPLVQDATALLALIDARHPEPIQLAALAALQSSDHADAILARVRSSPATIQRRAAETLLTRPSSALTLLAAIDAAEFPKDLLTVDQLRPLAQFKDAQLDALIRKHYGNVRGPTPEEKLADVRRLNNELRAAPGDATAGRALFQKNCGICHRLYDDGADVGPDLTHANRKDRDYLLVSIVDPSTVVRSEHVAYIIETSDGQVLTGLIAEQSPALITLKNASNVRTTVERGKIRQMRESPLSLMPEGIITQMPPQQVRDLFAYLQSDHPVAAGD